MQQILGKSDCNGQNERQVVKGLGKWKGNGLKGPKAEGICNTKITEACLVYVRVQLPVRNKTCVRC